MKYLKTYEDTQEKPQVGDYVLCKNYIVGDIEDRIASEIGIIKNYESEYDSYTIKYDPKKPPSKDSIRRGTNLYYYRRDVKTYSIIMWAKNKEDIEAYIQSKKYNL